MAQFDYYANTDKDINRTYPFIVDVQDALLEVAQLKGGDSPDPASQPQKTVSKKSMPGNDH